MTRTERSFSPRAIIKDRSESRTGLDKSDRKGGAGAHNWGSFADERQLELLAAEDYEEEEEEASQTKDELSSTSSDEHKHARDSGLAERRTSNISEEEIQQARQFRAKALKDGSVDLSAIARTSVAVSSPSEKTSSAPVATPITVAP